MSLVAFNPAYVVPMQVGTFRQLLLRDLHLQTKLADPDANRRRKVAPHVASSGACASSRSEK
jgi:hypothetical protein